MRQMCVVLVIALSMAAAGREANAETMTAGSTVGPLARAFEQAISRESSLHMTRYPGPHHTARCCNVKGAALGAGIGAALGFGLFAARCDGFGCATLAGRASGILGGLGATIGVFM